MKRELAERFNQEVENHRKALLYYARNCDWKTFEAKAGRLFDYVESIEFRELERRFFTVFNLILVVLVVAVIALFTVNFEVHQDLLRLKHIFVVSALAVISYEFFFYLDYRTYINFKTFSFKKRRESFIRNIEQDFRGYAAQPEPGAALSSRKETDLGSGFCCSGGCGTPAVS
jgi:hypothetical protein